MKERRLVWRRGEGKEEDGEEESAKKRGARRFPRPLRGVEDHRREQNSSARERSINPRPVITAKFDIRIGEPARG